MYILDAFVYDYLIMSKLNFSFPLDIKSILEVPQVAIDWVPSSFLWFAMYLHFLNRGWFCKRVKVFFQHCFFLWLLKHFLPISSSTLHFCYMAGCFTFHILQLPCNYFTASLQNFLHEMLSNFKWTKCNMKNHKQEKSTNT